MREHLAMFPAFMHLLFFVWSSAFRRQITNFRTDRLKAELRTGGARQPLLPRVHPDFENYHDLAERGQDGNCGLQPTEKVFNPAASRSDD
jgi:hypothetical protein